MTWARPCATTHMRRRHRSPTLRRSPQSGSPAWCSPGSSVRVVSPRWSSVPTDVPNWCTGQSTEATASSTARSLRMPRSLMNVVFRLPTVEQDKQIRRRRRRERHRRACRSSQRRWRSRQPLQRSPGRGRRAPGRMDGGVQGGRRHGVITPFEAHLATPAAVSVLSTVDWTDEAAVSHLPPGAARATLDRLIADRSACSPIPNRELFAAEISADGHVVTGLLAVVSAGHEVRPHERVFADRVASLARHLGEIGAETVPVTLAHRRQPGARRQCDRTSSRAHRCSRPRSVGSSREALGGRSRMPVGRPPLRRACTSSTATTVSPPPRSGAPGFLALIVPAEPVAALLLPPGCF